MFNLVMKSCLILVAIVSFAYGDSLMTSLSQVNTNSPTVTHVLKSNPSAIALK
jgi:hypothetical protein